MKQKTPQGNQTADGDATPGKDHKAAFFRFFPVSLIRSVFQNGPFLATPPLHSTERTAGMQKMASRRFSGTSLALPR
jgi:hypothetical protein